MKIRWIIILAFVTVQSFGQGVTINQDLPQEGDQSYFYIDHLPSSIDPGSAGQDQRWSFMTLQAPFIRKAEWKDGELSLAGNRFKGADLSFQLDEDTEAYYQKKQNAFYLMGYFGNDPFGLGIRALYKYDEPIRSFSSSIKMGDKSSSKSSMTTLCTLRDLPDAVRSILPTTPDSIRLIMVSKRVDEVDAWGTMLMPGGFFEVLREKRSEARNLRIEVKTGSLPWQDITELLAENDVFGEHVFLSYHFFSADIKEPLVQIYMKAENKGVDKVIYRANQTEEGLIQSTSAIKPGVYAFPNPAIVNVRFEFANLKRGQYRLSIQNVLGVEVWAKDYIIDHNFIDLIDVSFLSKGTYLYSLQDSNGNFLMTRRIVIIRP